ncbi:hypothetical protein HX880_37215 [Pseudomonas sp. F1002]|nr:hypothetical protein [Pseudomonas sp. F1002]
MKYEMALLGSQGFCFSSNTATFLQCTACVKNHVIDLFSLSRTRSPLAIFVLRSARIHLKVITADTAISGKTILFMPFQPSNCNMGPAAKVENAVNVY